MFCKGLHYNAIKKCDLELVGIFFYNLPLILSLLILYPQNLHILFENLK